MGSRDRFLSAGNRQLQTRSELVQWASLQDRPVTEKRLAYIVVYSFRTQIYKTSNFLLQNNELLLGDLLDRLSKSLGYTSHELSFVLVSWKLENQLPVVSTTNFGSQLSFRVSTRGVAVTLRPRGYEKIISSINSSVSQVRNKTHRAPLRDQRPKGLRANPETRSVAYEERSAYPGNMSIVPKTKLLLNRTYTSVRTPGFVSLRKQGKLPPNPYTMVRIEVSQGYYFSDKVWTGQSWFNTFESTANSNLVTTDIPAGHLAVDENLLIAKLAGKINKSRSNIAESLIQGNQSVRLISDSVSRFGTFISLINGGSPDAIRKFLGNAKGSSRFVRGVVRLRKAGLAGVALLAQLWLEYRYGWIPLVSDVEASMSAFKSLSLKNPGILSVTSSKRSTRNVLRKVIYATNPDTSPRTRYYYETQTTVCKIGIRYKLDSNLLQTASGLGLTSPIALAWELAPFSFVVDWFLPIGPALQAFSAFEGLVFMSGYKTYLTKSKVILKVKEQYTHVDSNPLNSYVLKQNGDCEGERVSMSRVVLTNFPGPKVPQLKSPFSFIHAANAAALIAKALTR